jgi:DNA adenine methylase
MKEITVTPFLRWAGGKRWLAAHLAPALKVILEHTKGTYYEPFLGAGSMYFCLAAQKSILSDLNKDLINCYTVVRDHSEKVKNIMKRWEVLPENYYRIRSYRPKSMVNKAARFIWLNRTCYGGLYRVNKKNNFNVPYGGGRTPDILYKQGILEKCSVALRSDLHFGKSVELVDSDFEDIIKRSMAGDVVYCDPTYSCVTRDSFDRYGADIYKWDDQIRLAKAAMKASERGATVIISNAYSDELVDLFSPNYLIQVSKKKSIGNIPNNPEKHLEYLFIYDPDQRHKNWKEFVGNMKNSKLL